MDKNIKKVEFEVGVEGTVISVPTDNETDQYIRLSDKVKYDNQEYTVGTMLAVVLFLLGCGLWSLFAIPLFYYWYGIEWLARLAIYRNKKTAYKNVSFECEAYNNQGDLVYLDQRKPFAWIKYIFGK